MCAAATDTADTATVYYLGKHDGNETSAFGESGLYRVYSHVQTTLKPRQPKTHVNYYSDKMVFMWTVWTNESEHSTWAFGCLRPVTSKEFVIGLDAIYRLFIIRSTIDSNDVEFNHFNNFMRTKRKRAIGFNRFWEIRNEFGQYIQCLPIWSEPKPNVQTLAFGCLGCIVWTRLKTHVFRFTRGFFLP